MTNFETKQVHTHPIGMYDSSNESSQRTELGYVNHLEVLSIFFFMAK